VVCHSRTKFVSRERTSEVKGEVELRSMANVCDSNIFGAIAGREHQDIALIDLVT
jgi:hypothetical protein